MSDLVSRVNKNGVNIIYDILCVVILIESFNMGKCYFGAI